MYRASGVWWKPCTSFKRSVLQLAPFYNYTLPSPTFRQTKNGIHCLQNHVQPTPQVYNITLIQSYVNSSTNVTPSLWPLSGHIFIYTIGLATVSSVNCTYQQPVGVMGIIDLKHISEASHIYGSVALSVLSCFTVQCGMF